MAVAVLLAFALGVALALYLAWSSGWLARETAPKQPQTAQVAALPGQSEMQAVVPDGKVATDQPIPTDMRVAELERRLNRLDLEAEAASGHAARAEGLLIAFAARRLIERGSALGYLENQLQLRFGNAQPNAVRTIINASQNPVTLDSLRLGLDKMSTEAVEAPASLSGWERVKAELSDLFVVRSSSAPSPEPEQRLSRARQLLDDGRVEAAAALVERLPNHERLAPWIADANRYIAVHDALDLVETAALLEPRQLMDAEGQPVRQPSPAGPSPAAPTSAASAAN